MRDSAAWSLGPSCCRFTDILEIWDTPAQDARRQIMSLDSFEEQVDYARRLPRRSTGWCEAHGCHCPFTNSKLRVQGPPCPDWSTAGKRMGTQGQHLAPLLACGIKTQVTSPDVVVVENVPAFPLEVAGRAYGPCYTWLQTYQEPVNVGFDFVARHRT